LRLAPDIAALGDQLLVFDQIDSTMDEAKRQFSDGLLCRKWIVGIEQGVGRGRQGRVWHSPLGNLHVTLVLPAPCAIRHQPKLGFVAGVALVKTLKGLLPNTAEITLKWPNDLLLNGAKTAGLLVEGLGNGAAVAIGLGINIVAHPNNTPYPAAHLQSCAPQLTAPIVLENLSGTLMEELQTFGDGSGFPLTRQRWLAASAHLGKTVSVRASDTTQTGLFKNIDEDGRLLLETTTGTVRIDAGDVFPLDK
jgi:BirA family transcriptional regulator, biotin operon repressor / biotin---[acetyl-CoA-carboxylase] ligase